MTWHRYNYGNSCLLWAKQGKGDIKPQLQMILTVDFGSAVLPMLIYEPQILL